MNFLDNAIDEQGIKVNVGFDDADVLKLSFGLMLALIIAGIIVKIITNLL